MSPVVPLQCPGAGRELQTGEEVTVLPSQSALLVYCFHEWKKCEKLVRFLEQVRQLYGRFLHEVQRDVPAALKQYELCLEVAEKEIKADVSSLFFCCCCPLFLLVMMLTQERVTDALEVQVLLRIGVLSVLAEDFDRARSAFSEAADLDPPSCVTHKVDATL